MGAPELDGKVTESVHGGWSVVEHEEPASMPATPTVKLKGVEKTADVDFTRAEGKFTWVVPISIYAEVEVYDGASLEWRWSAAAGDLVGGP